MSAVEIFVLSTALGADLFSVAIPLGMTKISRATLVKASIVFAVFHVVMILTGYFLGQWLGRGLEEFTSYYISAVTIENWARIIGALVLVGLGIYMIIEKTLNRESSLKPLKKCNNNPLKGFALILLAISVSIDALAVGLSLGMIEVNLFNLNLILGIVIFFISVLGLTLGKKIGMFIGNKAAVIGGFILVLLGVNVLLQTYR